MPILTRGGNRAADSSQAYKQGLETILRLADNFFQSYRTAQRGVVCRRVATVCEDIQSKELSADLSSSLSVLSAETLRELCADPSSSLSVPTVCGDS